MSYIIKLGFSPCPNDTFIFDAIINKKIDTHGIDFICEADDIEQLNLQALSQDLDMTKISYHAFLHAAENYQLLESGSALGNNCGPLLISKNSYTNEEVNDLQIAIPGKYTTAALLLKYAFPHAQHLHEFRFSGIENRIQKESIDAGVIIHESRFTYEEKGLHKIMDLGEYWEKQTGFPIPLGGIVVKKDMPHDLKRLLAQIMHESVMYAFEHPDSSIDFIKEHAAELDDDVIKKHIALYVNEYTKSLGSKGRQAIESLFDFGVREKIIARKPSDIFFDF